MNASRISRLVPLLLFCPLSLARGESVASGFELSLLGFSPGASLLGEGLESLAPEAVRPDATPSALAAALLGQTGGPAASTDRAGYFDGRFGMGFTASPDTFLMGFEFDYFLLHNLAFGPLFQLGVTDRWLLFAPTANVRAVFDLPGDLERLQPFAQAGMGFVYIDDDNNDVGEADFLINFGGGLDFFLTDNLAVGTSMLFNIVPGEVFDDRFFFSWQVGTVTFRF